MMTTCLLHFLSTLMVTNSELILDNIDILFIHKFRDKLVRDAVLVNISRGEICDHYWADHETWEVWTVEQGRKVVSHVRTVNTIDNDIAMEQTLIYNRYSPSLPRYFCMSCVSLLGQGSQCCQFG